MYENGKQGQPNETLTWEEEQAATVVPAAMTLNERVEKCCVCTFACCISMFKMSFRTFVLLIRFFDIFYTYYYFILTYYFLYLLTKIFNYFLPLQI